MAGFEAIPAVDIKGGKCVRLYRGEQDRQTVFSDDPLEAARSWEAQGASLVHVVDLDGAFEGRPVNGEVIKDVMRKLTVPVQVGGGIREMDTANMYVDAGALRVIIGTRAFTDHEWLIEIAFKLGERIAVGLDVREGRVATAGWLGDSGITPAEALETLAGAGVKRVIYTDVMKDGTLTGPNFKGIEAMARDSTIPIIASGGVGSIDDILRISNMSELGVEGVIVGMALYRNKFTLEQARSALEERGIS